VAGKTVSSTSIPRTTLASVVGERIRSDIIDGVLQPGTQLNEVELAASFGVSRGPVREAVQRLIQEGLLRSEPHRGVFVPTLAAADIDDIYLAREALETAALRRVAGTSRAESSYKALDRIVRAMESAERSDDWRTVVRRDLDFHTALVAAAESPRLERMFTTVISETRLCLVMLTDAYGHQDLMRRREDLVQEHRQILELVHAGDVEGAVAVLKKHFAGGMGTLKRRMAADTERPDVG
jgi:DNA-binding GntR family transcriptional regulator